MRSLTISVPVAVMAASLAVAEPSVERGEYLVEGLAGCGNCHTPIGPDGPVMEMNLAGRLVEDIEPFRAVASNITPGGRVAGWSDAELARAIREGIRPDGSVIGPPMPSVLYQGLSDDDLGSIVMYLRTVPAVENDPGESEYRIPLPPAWGQPGESRAQLRTKRRSVQLANIPRWAVTHSIEINIRTRAMGASSNTHIWPAGVMEFQRAGWCLPYRANLNRPFPRTGSRTGPMRKWLVQDDFTARAPAQTARRCVRPWARIASGGRTPGDHDCDHRLSAEAMPSLPRYAVDCAQGRASAALAPLDAYVFFSAEARNQSRFAVAEIVRVGQKPRSFSCFGLLHFLDFRRCCGLFPS